MNTFLPHRDEAARATERQSLTTVVVYTTGDACVQCRLTKQVMDAVGLVYEEVDLTMPSNANAREYVTDDLGYSSAPIVVVDDNDHWTGFRPDRIKQLGARIDAGPTSMTRD